jgi:methanogenic corrinoid protein MtbC1
MNSAEAQKLPDLAALRARYLAAQLAGDRREAPRLVVDEGLRQGASVLDVQLEVIQEAQREIGRLWQEDRIGTAQEHMATAISHLALAHLYQHAPASPPNGKRVLLACVEGEQHEFPARIAADALDLAGFEVRFLGASQPTAGLLRLLAEVEPHLVALSVTMSFNVPSLRDTVRAIREATGGRVPIAVGGHACLFGPTVAAEVGADLTGGDARALVDGARRLLGVSP